MKNRKNFRTNALSQRAQELKSTARSTARGRKSTDLLRKSADSAASLPPEFRTDEPGAQVGNDGRIRDVLDRVVSSPLRDERGQFVRGLLKTGEHSEALWSALAPVKTDIVDRVRRQLGIDDDDGRETLLAIIDGFAEAHLLRKSAFMRLCTQGGPVS